MNVTNLDYQIFQMINDQAIRHGSLNGFMCFFAQDAQYLLLLGMIIYWFTRNRLNRMMAIEAAISVLLGMGISFVIGHFLYRDRPFVDHTVIQLIKHAANASFPSDHAIGAFAIATMFLLYGKRMRFVWIIIAALIGFSRVWTGVHYPTDVIAGAIIGIVCSVVTHQICSHSNAVNKLIISAIRIYESLETKIWTKRTETQTRNM
ncbi:undecaprenyl-diphosphatase [Paenibacillus sediminis]|uniref:Undecaprenyl-diphosphatase n=1 Tax=Paenibacillus sediminis TaxID=664909 RepID=A0ABS4H1M6_9BACL|nr:undecaprenyl-diphosphatase [Paenibacillus sediminis]MBP1936172.1 undecaprenyl-diphosphatase [Paenibacillus sediminis]